MDCPRGPCLLWLPRPTIAPAFFFFPWGQWSCGGTCHPAPSPGWMPWRREGWEGSLAKETQGRNGDAGASEGDRTLENAVLYLPFCRPGERTQPPFPARPPTF